MGNNSSARRQHYGPGTEPRPDEGRTIDELVEISEGSGDAGLPPSKEHEFLKGKLPYEDGDEPFVEDESITRDPESPRWPTPGREASKQ